MVTLHVLGASVWVGGHVVLSLVVLPRAMRARDAAAVLQFESGFEKFGIPALLIQVATGIWLAQRWVPGVANWFAPASPQATWILVKLSLLVATILLAAHARLRIIPRLDSASLPALAMHIVAVTVISVAFLVAGVLLRTGGF